MSKKDAWRQYSDLVERFTQESKVRPDLKVRAIAYNRHVTLSIGERREDDGSSFVKMYPYIWHDRIANVSTMRELAKAINDACDFVEEMNPIWASSTPWDGKKIETR